MFFQKIDWKLKWNFQSLSDWKYKVVELSEWRSNLQNSLYWWWYIPHIIEVFWERGIYIKSDELHENLKELLLQKRKLNKLTWTYKKYIKSTSDMTKKEFIQYLKDVENYMFQEHDITIPPHDIDF